MARTRPAITDDRNVRFPPQRYPPCIGGLRAVDANECQTTGRFSAKSAGAAKSDPHHCNGGRGAPPVGCNRDGIVPEYQTMTERDRHARPASLRLASDHARRLRDRHPARGAQDARHRAAAVIGRAGLAALVAAVALAGCTPAQAESVVRLPAATFDPAVKASRATAIFAGGRFWGVEGVFSNVKRSEA